MTTEQKQRLLRMGAILFTLFVSALLWARGVTQLLASSLLPTLETPQAKPAGTHARARSEPPEPSPQQLAEAVLTRNIFDSSVGPMDWQPPVPVVESGMSDEQSLDAMSDPEGEPAPCQGSLRLVGSFVVPRVPELSFVSIEAGGQTMLYRTGMQVEGHDVVGIREHRVFLRPSGRQLCQITMFQQPVSAEASDVEDEEVPTESVKPSRASGRGGLSEEDLSQGVTKVSDTQYSVERSLLDKVLANQSELMRMARIVPHEEGGQVIGVKVYGIRRSSLLGKLGIQNGDILRTINGFDLASPDSALEAYTKLRETSQFTISMVRRGTQKNMNYSVK